MNCCKLLKLEADDWGTYKLELWGDSLDRNIIVMRPFCAYTLPWKMFQQQNVYLIPRNCYSFHWPVQNDEIENWHEKLVEIIKEKLQKVWVDGCKSWLKNFFQHSNTWNGLGNSYFISNKLNAHERYWKMSKDVSTFETFKPS